jgi:hypothetical protein
MNLSRLFGAAEGDQRQPARVLRRVPAPDEVVDVMGEVAFQLEIELALGGSASEQARDPSE